VANVTGLDYLGIPVFLATRPNSRALSVSQGKGLDEETAMASALMEAAEIAHAEQPHLAVVHSSFARLAAKKRAADPRLLPRLNGGRFTRHSPIDWVEGRDLMTGRPVHVPFDLVHTDFTRPQSVAFGQSSNGLASGNHYLEAIIAGLCETIERDATALWDARTTEEMAGRRLRPRTVRSPDCRTLLDRLDDCGMSVAVWDSTTDIGVACFICRVSEAPGNDLSALRPFWGAGCHLDRSIALTRAITEAAQSRLTYISGSRDDLQRRNYARANGNSLFALVLDTWEQSFPGRRFSDVPSLATDTMEDDVEILLQRLQAVGLDQAIAVDLSDARMGLSVVRVIVPGLENHDPGGRVRPGARLRSLRAQSPA
jgi:YcaO-like protein with predicted kinase domain